MVTSSGSSIKDKSKFGVFGSDLTTEFAKDIADSKTDKSVFRGTAQIGGDIMAAMDKMVKTSISMLKNEDFLKDDYAQVDEIDADNIAKFSK